MSMFFHIKVPMVFSEQMVKTLLITAFEGGSNYWVRSGDVTKPVKGAEFLQDHAFGGEILLIVDDPRGDEETVERLLNADVLERGLMEFASNPRYRRHYFNWLKEEDDAETGDVFLQVCLFGEVIFG
jgi:hypothetical protein